MLKVFHAWVDRYFSDEEAVVLFLILGFGLLFVVLWGDIMAPVIASVIFAFVLQGMVTYLYSKGVNKTLAVYLSFTFFMGIVITFIFYLLPLVWRQLSSLVKDSPNIFNELKTYIFALRDQYPAFVSIQEMENLYQRVTVEAAGFGQWLLSQSIESFPVVITILIYFIVVPILVFFFVKDKDQLLSDIAGVLPKNRVLMTKVWDEMNVQFANYVRGKVVEIVVVGGVTYIGFLFMGLNYGALLAILVGLSVVIPYIGAVLVTIPVMMIALFQFGFQEEFYYVMLVFLVIQIIDGNVLVPLLFSEVVNLHPVIIIISVLFFGGVWGVWGVFFAIPLATLVKAVLTSWPRRLALD
ncbi:MAG: putative permease [Oleiphilaceae bacterium]|jgi:putative permease